MRFQKAATISNMITAFSILLQLHGILLISLMNQKRVQQTILNEILSDRRRTIKKIKMAKQKNLNKKKELAAIKLVGQTYGGNVSYRE